MVIAVGYRFVAVAVAFVAALAIGELGARVVGRYHLVTEWRNYQPATRVPIADGWADYDPELGWVNASNRRLTWSGGPATFLPDRSRATSTEPRENDQRPVVLVLGCSYTQGFGVSDQETFAWKLQ